jgi:hypothetical protein
LGVWGRPFRPHPADFGGPGGPGSEFEKYLVSFSGRNNSRYQPDHRYGTFVPGTDFCWFCAISGLRTNLNSNFVFYEMLVDLARLPYYIVTKYWLQNIEFKTPPTAQRRCNNRSTVRPL